MNGSPARDRTAPVPAGLDRGLLKALTHPLRTRILQVLTDGVASPVQLSRTLGEPLGTVSYHMRVLLESGCVELARTRPRRGATEHFYRALTRPLLDDAEWRTIPAALRRQLSGRTLAELLADAGAAAADGGFDGDEVHVIRLPLSLDETGWSAVAALVAETLERALATQAAALSRGGPPSRRGELGLLLFERPAG